MSEAAGARPEPAAGPGLVRRLGLGALAGLVGGLAFGLFMTATGMLGLVGALVGRQGDLAASWLVHLVLATVIGAGFGALATLAGRRVGRLAALGAAYGLAWWILGPMVLMSEWLGQGLALSPGVMAQPGMRQSLVGHILYGLVTALAYAWLARR